MNEQDPMAARVRQMVNTEMAGLAVPEPDVQAIRMKAERLPRGRSKRLGWIAAALAAVLTAGITLPIGSLAQNFLNIFQPTQFVAVPITKGELATLPRLSNLGTGSRQGPPTIGAVSSASQASALIGFPAQLPQWLPKSLTAMTPVMSVVQEGTLTYTFKSSIASPTVAGSTLVMQIPPALMVLYGGPSAQSLSTASSVPPLALVEVRAPVLKSTGANVAEIENFLLAQPGVSPSLRAALTAIGDPTSTLPIPIPTGAVSSQTVLVQGNNGLVLQGERESALIWRQGSEVFALAGPGLTSATLVQIGDHLQP